jgi:large subunit ribosomal protein L25
MEIEVIARKRAAQGTGASRRLRNNGFVPGIVYGGKDAPVAIELVHEKLWHQLRKEAFHASVLSLNLEGQKQQVLLRAVNMHPFKPQVQHIDFQRVLADQKIHMKVPLHFTNADASPAVKVSAAIISHVMNELALRCLPADLPEFIEVDLSLIAVGHSIHVRDLKLPKGVEAILKGDENPVVVTAQVPRVIEETVEAEATPSAADVPATKQAEPVAGAKAEEGKDAKDAKKEDKGGKDKK